MNTTTKSFTIVGGGGIKLRSLIQEAELRAMVRCDEEWDIYVELEDIIIEDDDAVVTYVCKQVGDVNE